MSDVNSDAGMAAEAHYHECPNIPHQIGRIVGSKVRHFVLGFREAQYVSEERKILTNLFPRVQRLLVDSQIVVNNTNAIFGNTESLSEIQGVIMGQVEELRTAIIDNAAAAEEAVGRVEAKLAELGDPDPDLTNDIATIRLATAQIKSIADPATPDPGDEGFDAGPVVGEQPEPDVDVDSDAEPVEEDSEEQSDNV